MGNDNGFKGKTIAITGASRGIGLETAIQLERLGANLILGARQIDELNIHFQCLNSNVLIVPLDVREEGSVKEFHNQAERRFGTVDALINAAGIGRFSAILDMDTEDFDEMIMTNLRGTFLCCKSFAKAMAANRQGQILNLVSIAGTAALPECGGYSASKFGVLGFTRVLQAELRGRGVRVTSVLPGAVQSSFWDKIEPKPDVENMIPVSSIARHLIHLLRQPEDAVVDEITIMPPLGIL